MEYSIPDESMVKEIVRKVLLHRGVVESQAELRREVLKHLQHRNGEYTISGKRLRRIALEMKDVKVEIHCKTTDVEVNEMDKCPVCGSEMEKIENMTLEGEKITIGFKCVHCPYWTGHKLRVPIRYVFRKR